MTALRKGMSFSQLVRELENSDEARLIRGSGTLGGLSDGDFFVRVAEILSSHYYAAPKDVEFWKEFLREIPEKRTDLFQRLIQGLVAREMQEGKVPYDPNRCLILGTNRYLTRSGWEERALELGLAEPNERFQSRSIGDRDFKHSGNYTVSAIASLYRGRQFLSHFLENITSQTIFDRSELIIIDANSPEGEEELIAEYQKVYPNIVYKRINYRIGVYDAWNLGVEMARGRYLTNTNLDDLRRRDSFELQAATLDQHSFADVVYQDFFYSLDATLDFEQVASFGFKSELPIVTPHNLLNSNSPHNAPMWRKTLHAVLGNFDTSLKSAGDYEFWLRCKWKGKNFFKINTPHVVYFQNPEGISTRPDTKGIEEARRVMGQYIRRLISERLTMSRKAFAETMEIDPDWDWNTNYYDVVQSRLKLLGDRHKAGTLHAEQTK